jgi:FkbM family methyltransferase
MNRLGGIVIPIQAAVSDRCATAGFLANEHQGMNRLVSQQEEQDSAQVVQVPTITIDEFCQREKILPDFMKIDVEGFELAVLRGARETIKACGSRLSLFVEMHPTTWGEIGISKDDMTSELSRQGLRAVPLREIDDMWAVEGECLRLKAR